MKLNELLDVAAALGANPARIVGGAGVVDRCAVTGVAHDTAAVAPGNLFCCIRGSRADGHDLAPQALQAGASALVVDHPLEAGALGPGAERVPQIVVDDVRRAMAPLAAAFWDQPSRQLKVFGVTGTAGKTTMTQLIQSIVQASGETCGVIGTLTGARTTPEAPGLQAQLAAERDRGSAAVAMEVSSHGLDLHRVDATWFAAAVFTNLSRDHLDFHRTMEEYFAAKARLFSAEFTDHAVVCTDDSWGRRLASSLGGTELELHTYSMADAADLELAASGARFRWRGHPVRTHLTGGFNVANALGAATAAAAAGIPVDAIVAGLEATGPVSGRFEQVDEGQPFVVLVDYAHKPDALAQALRAARELCRGSLHVVFGCGGDRDAGKRPLMGEVAAELADRVTVTSDNPRSEDPLEIIDQILAGTDGTQRPGSGEQTAHIDVEPDRRAAIGKAVAEARQGDVILIAGKGHETTQITGDQVVPFDDRQVVREALSALGRLTQRTSAT